MKGLVGLRSRRERSTLGTWLRWPATWEWPSTPGSPRHASGRRSTEVTDRVWEALSAPWPDGCSSSTTPTTLGCWARKTGRPGSARGRTADPGHYPRQDPARWTGSTERTRCPRPGTQPGYSASWPRGPKTARQPAPGRRLGYLPIALRVAGTSALGPNLADRSRQRGGHWMRVPRGRVCAGGRVSGRAAVDAGLLRASSVIPEEMSSAPRRGHAPAGPAPRFGSPAASGSAGRVRPGWTAGATVS